MSGNSLEAGRTVIDRVFAILVVFTEGTEHALSDIARLAKIPVSTAHRLLTDLEKQGLIERTSDRRCFRAAPRLRALGTQRWPATLAERGPCVIEDLYRVTGVRVRLGVPRGTVIAYIEKTPGPGPATQFVSGALLPAHPTALGRMLLAYSDKIIAPGDHLRAYTPHTQTSVRQLRHQLHETRLRGIAFSDREFENSLCSAAMPVHGPDGTVIAAMEVSAESFDALRRHYPALSMASRSLSRELASAESGSIDADANFTAAQQRAMC